MAKKSKASKKTPKNPRPRKAAVEGNVAKPSMPTFDLGGPQKRRKIGIKGQVAALLLAGGAFTLEELLKETKAKQVTLRTALSDLKSAKYAGPTGVLPIVVQDGKFQLNREDRK
jgi:hypothetical protein